jgi:hypothetical protein
MRSALLPGTGVHGQAGPSYKQAMIIVKNDQMISF